MSWTVGFDLDMTLIDSRPGVARAVDLAAAELGIPVLGADVAKHIGPPLANLLRQAGAPEERLPELVARYRQLYPTIVPQVPAMPGADAALAAVTARGGRVLVVTGKHAPLAQLHLDELGWRVDHLAGDLWSAAKAGALREQGARIYVGDHVGDMRGAAAAGAVAVGVTTGPCDAAELTAAGADIVLADLTEFPDWFGEFVIGLAS
ncbi:HAD family hydrolase [Nocardia arthritidis]|uniref:HAD hydrolase-like protein n=1 Tax=Nocardia arthritidis TaxID=228602 RepID=A0A6G9YJ52_9NOCA|nr:HAD hydrolase-like protein [Nocardia arthritidis]QIS13066.1 HAD hydrolase-like protein [Nocardia arthritidis]